jgi:hypothetical protein
MAEDAESVDLTLGIQADIFIDLAADFARVNRIAAAETFRNIEDKIARDLRERAVDLRMRRLSAEYRASGRLPCRYDRGGQAEDGGGRKYIETCKRWNFGTHPQILRRTESASGEAPLRNWRFRWGD